MSFAATPWIDRTVGRLRAWPPPSGEAALEAARRVRAGDRHGHAVHLLAAIAFVVCSALDQAPSAVALGVLLGVSCIRAFVYPEAFTPMLRLPVFWLAVAWFAWSVLSIAWAPAGATPPVRALAGQRMLLAAAALWPVLGHARALASAIVLAASINALMQVAQQLGLAESTGTSAARPSGFVQLPVVASMWSIAAIGIALALWVEARTLGRVALVVASALCAAGIALAASRGPVLAAIPSGALLVVLLVAFGHARARTLAVPIGLVLASAVIAVLLPGTGLLRYAAAALGNPDHPAALSIELRFLWWRLALEQFAAHPVVGGGLGSFAAHIAGHPAVDAFVAGSGVPQSHVRQFHPHSTYLRALAELGLVGFTLVASLFGAVLAAGWRGARRDAVGCAAFAGVVFALLLAASECIEAMNLAFALTAVLAALCAFPREVRPPRA
jgi:O-antigen ligase